ncbi:glutamate:Na+ symporter, ESS family [Dethiosulfatibacter aminovorans DSM 17477]|uniref:Glutamate:Na+ symporter, ESS family n=1 Tax=Dethiosulfatibacter aminovorans DSM 17477 TaxID=1121476 RepID=A0A1M6K8E5_9FIRM|nr:sodium/glutamate symporter [Dethiosulfatibacter aminovorans]SHJ55248.1 glutamate:Na+ symporter, ESS family [Dethiosulfatibacter aminovorans DSM 17477]
MNFGPYDFLIDFCLMSVLLFLAQLMRSKIKLIQNLYLPSSLIAGFMGLVCSNQVLGILPFSEKISSYAYLGIVVLFASLFIGNENKGSFKQVINEVGDTFTLNMAAEIGQFGFSLLVGTFVLTKFFPEVNHAFSILLPAGFVGGHGYAAAIGGTLQDVGGWDEAITIGQTFATIGLLSGIIGGLILINIATRKGYTRLVKSMNQLPLSMQTGLVPKKERDVMGENTVSPMSIDPMTWHLLLILIATAGGYFAQIGMKKVLPGITLPMFSLSMLAGILVQVVLKAVKMDSYVDKRVITRIGSSITDYLVAFGVASIKISIVVKYAVPIIVMLAIGLFYAVFYSMVICRRLFKNYWFERSIFIYGWSTGVVAMGVTLLRIVDPEYRSKTLEDYGMAYVFISFVEILIVALLPLFAIAGNGMIAGGVLILIWLALMGVTAAKYGIKTDDGATLREGEVKRNFSDSAM